MPTSMLRALLAITLLAGALAIASCSSLGEEGGPAWGEKIGIVAGNLAALTGEVAAVAGTVETVVADVKGGRNGITGEGGIADILAAAAAGLGTIAASAAVTNKMRDKKYTPTPGAAPPA